MKARRYAWLLAACMMVLAGCSSTTDDRLNSSVGLLNHAGAHAANAHTSAPYLQAGLSGESSA